MKESLNTLTKLLAICILISSCSRKELKVELIYEKDDTATKITKHQQDSHFIFFETGFREDTVEIEQGGENIVELVLKTERSTGLADTRRIWKAAGDRFRIVVNRQPSECISWPTSFRTMRVNFQEREEKLVIISSNRLPVYM